MSDDDLTPPAGTPAWAPALVSVRKQCIERHERTNVVANKALALGETAKDRLIALVGEDGKNGALSELRADMAEIKTRVGKNEDRSIRNDKAIGAVALKLALIVAVAGTVGTIIANALMGKIHFVGG